MKPFANYPPVGGVNFVCKVHWSQWFSSLAAPQLVVASAKRWQREDGPKV